MSVLLYDGDCGFCSRCAAFLRRRVPTSAAIVAWQAADLTRLGVTAEQCAAAVQFVTPGRVSAGPEAIADLLRTARGPWWRLAGRLLATRPMLAVGWPVYRLVARNRHRLPGSTSACELPVSYSDKSGGTSTLA